MCEWCEHPNGPASCSYCHTQVCQNVERYSPQLEMAGAHPEHTNPFLCWACGEMVNREDSRNTESDEGDYCPFCGEEMTHGFDDVLECRNCG